MSDQDFKSAGEILPNLPVITEALKSNLNFESFEEIQFDTSSNSLIEHLIDHNSFVLLIGESNVGKTFFGLDIALAIARGIDWMGRKVEQGAVLYIASEGGRNIKKRIVAYRMEHGLEGKKIPFRIAYGSIDLSNSGEDIPSLLNSIYETEKLFNCPIRCVVIDTLNRALSGGDENASSDMGAFVKNVDLIRKATGATVFVIHHTGKDTTKGARGHSLLKGAIDTELSIRKMSTGHICIKITKQRDDEAGKEICLKLKQVDLPSSTGETATSCVVVAADSGEDVEFKKVILNEMTRKALEVLREIVSGPLDEVTVEEWRKSFIEKYYKNSPRQTKSDAFKKAKNNLAEHKYITIEGEIVRLTSS